jgi:hypothetical protein
MNDYMPFTSFYAIYKEFWESNKNDLNRVVTDMLENMFSSTTLRIINAKKINPIGFKNVTLYLDGHDSRINYNEKDIKKRNFYSYKFKNSGLRTQVIYDINEFAIYISKSKPCKNYNDGGYYYYIEKFIENCENKGNDKVNRNNFMFPIRKAENIDLKDEEILYSETLGSFRSKIESCFGLLGNKVKRFNNNESSVKVTRYKNI